VRTIFGLAVAVLAVSSPAFSQPTCDDDAVLQRLVATYFGLSEYRGMTEAQIRDKIIAAPEMLHWRGMAKEKRSWRGSRQLGCQNRCPSNYFSAVLGKEYSGHAEFL
jgi:hypothetical protein